MPEELRRPSLPARASGPEPRSLLSPWTAFALVLLILAATGIWLLSNRERSVPQNYSSPPQGTSALLSESQALDRFRTLNGLRLRVYTQLDASLVPLIAISGSPLQRTLLNDLEELRRKAVIAKPLSRIRRLDVVSNSTGEIRIRQIGVFDMQFFDRRGKEVTLGGGLEKQVVNWVLRPRGAEWFLYDASLQSARSVKDHND